jgi:hypothetical protein
LTLSKRRDFRLPVPGSWLAALRSAIAGGEPPPAGIKAPGPPRWLLAGAFVLALLSTSGFLFHQDELLLLCREQFDVVTILQAAREASPATVWGWWHGPWIQGRELPYYRPLTSMLYLAEWRLFGHHYVLYSLVSWLFHALNTTLLCALVYQLAPGSAARRRVLAGWAAILFTVPYWGNMGVAAKVLYWWPAQGDMVSLGFGLAALLCVIAGRSLVAVGVLMTCAILSKEMAYVVPPIIWLLAADPARRSRLRLVVVTALLAATLWLLRHAFVPDALGFKWKGLYSLKKLYFHVGGPLAQMVEAYDWPLPLGALGGAVLLWLFAQRGQVLAGALAALVWVGLCFEWFGESWTRITLPPNPQYWVRGLAYWFALAVLWRWRREEPVLFAVGAILLIHLPLLHHGGVHYVYWPAAGWAIVNTVAVACAARYLRQ